MLCCLSTTAEFIISLELLLLRLVKTACANDVSDCIGLLLKIWHQSKVKSSDTFNPSSRLARRDIGRKQRSAVSHIRGSWLVI